MSQNAMTVKQARRWIVNWSLCLISFRGVVFLAPVSRYPLDFPKSTQLIQIIFPCFLGVSRDSNSVRSTRLHVVLWAQGLAWRSGVTESIAQ